MGATFLGAVPWKTSLVSISRACWSIQQPRSVLTAVRAVGTAATQLTTAEHASSSVYSEDSQGPYLASEKASRSSRLGLQCRAKRSYSGCPGIAAWRTCRGRVADVS